VYSKQNRFYADWRDKQGRRQRKAFKTEGAALTHEQAMKDVARPKGKGVGRRSQPPSAPTSKRGKGNGEKTGEVIPCEPLAPSSKGRAKRTVRS
jgi:hypothetical protein